MSHRFVGIVVAIAIVFGVERAHSAPPSRYELAFVVVADVRGAPRGDQVPESTAAKLSNEVAVGLNADSFSVRFASAVDSLAVCASIRARACDIVVVSESVLKTDGKIEVALRAGSSKPGPHRLSYPGTLCDTGSYGAYWKQCREKVYRKFREDLQNHARGKPHAR